MPFKDITEKHANAVIDVLYNVIKKRINWKAMQEYIPNKSFFYSEKKKCQIILAFSDAVSDSGYKFSFTEQQQWLAVNKYMKQFDFFRSVDYMKAYRNHFLVDIFGLFTTDYDDILKKCKFSMEDALSSVKVLEMNLIKNMAEELSKETMARKEFYPDEDDEEEFQQFIAEMSFKCASVESVAAMMQCNSKRASSNLVGTLFDMQSLAFAAFDPALTKIQNIMDEWELVELKHQYAEMLSMCMKNLSEYSKLEYAESHEFDATTMRRNKVFDMQLIDENDKTFNIEFTIYVEDPMMIKIDNNKPPKTN